MKFEAVIFDLDGTLVDSEPVFKAVAKRTAQKFDRDFSDALFMDLLGLPGHEVEAGIRAAFGADFPLNAFREEFGLLWREYVDEFGIAPKPHAIAFVDILSELGIPHGIATSTAHARARESLDLAGFGSRIATLIGGDEVTNGKPAPDIYLKAASTLVVDAKRCIALEDSKVGVSAAAAAKMYTIMVPDLKQPDAQTKALADSVQPDLESALAEVTSLLVD